ncbi:hypothetical protein ACIQM4_01075 [Streptomyces sp. NPDC091272]|uniref:hypothetical protein n=1 Tax=Streptomyces sp. NPDC091272 TaxID=3365981 RepID=UPI00382476F4
MSEPDEGASAEPAGGGDAGAGQGGGPAGRDGAAGGGDNGARGARGQAGGRAGGAGGGADGEGGAEGDGQKAESSPFEQAGKGPLGGSGGGVGGSGPAHAARQNFAQPGNHFATGGDSVVVQGSTVLTQHYHGDTYGSGAVGSTMVAGPVPQTELDRLADVYCEAAGYQQMKELLRGCGLLVLCGEPGSGRTATALALLSELTDNREQRLDPDNRVHRLDPGNPLHRIKASDLTEGHGYLLELPPDEPPQHPSLIDELARGESRGGERWAGAYGWGPGRPTGLHLDRLSGLLAEKKAYAVVLARGGELAGQFLRGRYGLPCLPPPTGEVLRRHLRVLLKDAPEGAMGEAGRLFERPETKEALGLDELRPREAARLAEQLAGRVSNRLTAQQLAYGCAEFVRIQARAWFADADRPGTLPAALPVLDATAFRIAVAVFNGSSYSLTAEAGEQLVWELAMTLDPEQAVGRRLFAVHDVDRPALARAVVEDGEFDLGDAKVPMRAVRFQGRGLATAVLQEVWHGYHNVRGPLTRWLRALCDDPRPHLWVRASIAAGVLCSWDWVYGAGELLHPMAAQESPTLQMSAATALAEASREPSVRPAARTMLKEWARSGDACERATALLTHGYGMAAGSVGASLDALAKVARQEDVDLDELVTASFSVTRLLAGSEPALVVARLGGWLREDRRELANLVLLAVIRALQTKATYLWGLHEDKEMERHGAKPLIAALLVTRPELARRLADLIRHTLVTARSGDAALEALASWLRRAAKDAEQLRLVCRFLPLLAVDHRDRERLRHLLDRLVRDPGDPLAKPAAQRMWNAVGEGAGG